MAMAGAAAVAGVAAATYNTTLFVADDLTSLQPFGALGGASNMMRHAVYRVTAARISTAYTCTSIQGADIICAAYGGAVEDDAFCRIVAALACTANTDPVALPDEEKPEWYTNNASGNYGAIHQAAYYKLFMGQQRAEVVDADEWAKRTTTVAGILTLQVEKGDHHVLRFLSAGERTIALQWSCNNATKDLSLPSTSVTLPGTEKTLYSALIQQRIQHESARNTQLLSQHAPAPPPSPDVDKAEVSLHNIVFLHVTAVSGAMDRARSGCAALQTVCDLADQHGLPLLLEALPQGMLVTFYEKFGFLCVHLEDASVEMSQRKPFLPRVLDAQGWVVMWRPARKEAVAAPTLIPDLASRIAAIDFYDENDATRRSIRHRPRYGSDRNHKLAGMKLSLKCSKMFRQKLVWMKGQTYVAYPYTWAKVATALLREKVWATSPYTLPVLPAAPPAASSAAASPSRKRKAEAVPTPSSAATRPHLAPVPDGPAPGALAPTPAIPPAEAPTQAAVVLPACSHGHVIHIHLGGGTLHLTLNFH